MKYSTTIRNYCSLLALAIIVSLSANAQYTTRSPYSSYGIGDIESSALALGSSMGGVRYGIANPYQINMSNPASYGSLLTPSFNVDVNLSLLQIQQGTQKQRGNTGYIKNIALAFPVAKWWSFSVGIAPVSKMGYRYEKTETINDIGSITYTYDGQGGLNKVYFGNAFNILRDSSQVLSIGAHASYMFGNISKEKRVLPEELTGTFNTLSTEELKVSDYNFDFGLTYKRKLNSNLSASIGAVYGMGDSLRTYTSEFVHTYKGQVGREILKDTILYQLDTGNIYLPQTFGVGFTIQLNRKKDKYHQRYLLAFDYSTTDWSKLSLFSTNLGLAKRDQFSLGFQYIPDGKAYKNVQKMLNYRVGLRYANTHLVVDNTNVSEYGISFGVGVPIISAGKGTMFNFGLETGVRGANKNNLIREQFTNVFIGLSLAPSKFDRWFYKTKID